MKTHECSFYEDGGLLPGSIICACVCMALPLVSPLVVQRGSWEERERTLGCHSFTSLVFKFDEGKSSSQSHHILIPHGVRSLCFFCLHFMTLLNLSCSFVFFPILGFEVCFRCVFLLLRCFVLFCFSSAFFLFQFLHSFKCHAQEPLTFGSFCHDNSAMCITGSAKIQL